MKKYAWALVAGLIISSGVPVVAEKQAGSDQIEASHHARSHAIETVEYDEATRVLTLTFKRGAYRYEDVPVEVYEGLKNSDSKGTYFKENIRGKFKTAKVNGD